jgi:hypothetical protein
MMDSPRLFSTQINQFKAFALTLVLFACIQTNVRGDFVYVTDVGNNDIIQYNLAAANHPASVFATAATLSTALGAPVSAPFDIIQNGTNTYVAALGTGGILKFDGTSWTKQTLFAAASGSTPFNFVFPGYLAVQPIGATNYLLVNDYTHNQVLRFDLGTGRPAGAVAGSAVYISQTQNGLTLHGPTGLGVDTTTGLVYVVSSANTAGTAEIYKYTYTNSGTGVITAGATFTSAANSPSAGAGYAVDRLLNPEVSSFGDNRVIAYLADGSVSWTATAGSAGVNKPAGLVNDSTSPENMWIANSGAANILNLDNQTGALINTFSLANNSTVFSGPVPTNTVIPIGILYVGGVTPLVEIPSSIGAPEPSSVLLLGLGGLGLLGYAWRRGRRPAA